MSFHRYPIESPRNRFRLLPIGQAILKRARAAGVDTSDRRAVEAWRKNGEPDANGVVK